MEGKRLALLLVGLVALAGVGMVGVGGLTVGLAVGIRSCVAEAFEIQGPTMEPNYIDGDRVIVDKTGEPPTLGGVVIIRLGNGAQAIKRVAALAGDTVAFETNGMVVNGVPIPETPVDGVPGCFETSLGGVSFRIKRDPSSPPDSYDPVVVPDGHVYVLGDHRSRSNDSRILGPLPIDDIVGVVGDHYYRAEPRDPCEAP
jgi:signal peptidase I